MNSLFKISHAVIYHHKNDLCGTLQANTLASVYRRTLTLLLQPTNPPLHHAMAYLKQQQPSPDGPQVNHISWCERASERRAFPTYRYPSSRSVAGGVRGGSCSPPLPCPSPGQGPAPAPRTRTRARGLPCRLSRSQLPALPLRINVLLKVSKGFCWS